MENLLKAGALALALHSTLGLATPKDEQIKTDCARVDDYTQAGSAAYQQGQMDRAVDEFTAQAAWSEFCRLPAESIATAYNNVALALIRSGEPLKAAAWLDLAPDNSKTAANLALIQPIIDRLQAALATTPMGHYWRYAGRGVWSVLSVQPAGEAWKVSFDGYYMPAMGLYYGPNMGQFTVIQSLSGGHGVYQQDESADGSSCRVNMTFSNDSAHLQTVSGDCGFGMNVQADGDFKRVSLY